MNLKSIFLSLILIFYSNVSFSAEIGISDIKARQYVICGTSADYSSLVYKNNERLEGFDADICRAVATAIF